MKHLWAVLMGINIINVKEIPVESQECLLNNIHYVH